ncbi:BQ5605_C043g12087 [Microbotryum silenes-dioicae]|uniref:BQ5605_C043g12087 protein n=1 Tax=Microbotryum silenes-dioicae TaxID=796604 RepID=A0A2X0NIB2_9BASI|nr:BQ5605_C043g12087 [Microbotryum silenes-dioicae]
MAREVDSFRDAMYKIVTPLDAGAFEANIKALAKVAHVAPYLAAIPKQIREGFDFGIKDPPSEPHIAKNAPLTEKQQLDELEAAVGPFRTNPISYVPKSVAPGMPPKWGQIENLSFPTAKPIDRTTDPDEANHPSTGGHGPSQRSGSSSRPKLVSINDDLKSADSPCRWTTLPMLYPKFRELPSTAEVCGWDLADAFYQLPLRWDQRSSMCILWRGLIFVRQVPRFGGSTTPGVFGKVADLTQDLVEWKFPGVSIFKMVDNVCAVPTSDAISQEAVLHFVRSLGWRLAEQKGFTWMRQFFHVGIDWDLDLMTATVTDQKRMRYNDRIDALLKGSHADQKECSEVESVTGSLGYVAYILPALRTHLNCLYRQYIAYGDRKALSRARLDRRTYDQLEYWRRFLSSEGPLSKSFEALPIPSKLALALNACVTNQQSEKSLLSSFCNHDLIVNSPSNLQPPRPLFWSYKNNYINPAPPCMHGLGIVINRYSAYFALPEGWTDLPPPRHSVSITNAEAWAVEALAEAALRM